MNSLQNQNLNVSEISYLNKMLCPIAYRDRENNLFQFESLETNSKTNLESLLQYVSPAADLSQVPCFEKFYCDGAQISVLNYTKERINVGKKRDFFVNKNYLFQFTTDDCHSIAYKISHLPNILCLESKDDIAAIPGARIFIRILKDACALTHPKNDFPTKNLFTQIPFQIEDSENFIKTNPCMNSLVKNIAIEASLKIKPYLLQFNPRFSLPRFTILNHTEHTITFDIYRNFLINEEQLTNFTMDDRQIIAYHLEGHPELICFESKDETKEDANPRFFAEVSWKQTFKPKNKNILNEIHQKRMFNSFWRGLYDQNSEILQELPRDIVHEIMSLYFRTIPSLAD